MPPGNTARLNLFLATSADEYFVSNIEKVDSVTLLRKDKIMTGLSWARRFHHAVDTWPCLNDLGPSAASVRSTCQCTL